MAILVLKTTKYLYFINMQLRETGLTDAFSEDMIAQHVEGYPNAKSESSPKALANQDGTGGQTGPF